MPASLRTRRRNPAWSASHRRRQLPEAEHQPQSGVSQADIDESLQETFPASDPPTWTVLARIGSPRREPGP